MKIIFEKKNTMRSKAFLAKVINCHVSRVEIVFYFIAFYCKENKFMMNHKQIYGVS